jgi:hypothetical protein
MVPAHSWISVPDSEDGSSSIAEQVKRGFLVRGVMQKKTPAKPAAKPQAPVQVSAAAPKATAPLMEPAMPAGNPVSEIAPTPTLLVETAETAAAASSAAEPAQKAQGGLFRRGKGGKS